MKFSTNSTHPTKSTVIWKHAVRFLPVDANNSPLPPYASKSKIIYSLIKITVINVTSKNFRNL